MIGPAVRRKRVDFELTQDVLAARCQLVGWDLSRQTLSKIEAGVRRVNDAEVRLMAHVLRCEIRELFPTSIKTALAVARHSRVE